MSLAIENVVSAPRVISSCLPISTISISLVGSESRSTMLPASLAADVPVFMATPTSAWARAGASLVPSPVIATSLPPSCSRLISAILSSGVASARKSSTPASSAIARAVSGLSPVIITVRMPIRRISSNRSRMPAFTTSLRWMTPSTPGRCAPTPLGHDERRAAGGGDAVDDRRRPRPTPRRRCRGPTASTAAAAPLRSSRRTARRPSARSTPDIRVWAVNGTQVAWLSSPGCRSRRPYVGLGEAPRSSGPRASRRPGWTAGPRRPASAAVTVARPGRTRWPAGCRG